MRKRWRTWAAGLVAGAMIASSVQMPVYADMASDVEWLTAGNDEEPAESGADFLGDKKTAYSNGYRGGSKVSCYRGRKLVCGNGYGSGL